jgi:hypothetical protein
VIGVQSLCVQIGSEAHTASSPVATGCLFPGGKVWPRHDTDHLPPSPVSDPIIISFSSIGDETETNTYVLSLHCAYMLYAKYA